MAKSMAILTIGSLFWSTKAHRVAWRSERLAVKNATRVHAPIRYGRHSKRSGYTMVFSTGLLKEQFGWALAVPCIAVVDTFAQLIEEAEALWAAEKEDPSCKLAASWGAVGLLDNPNRVGLDSLIGEWSTRVATEHQIYKQFPHGHGEAATVTPGGLLAIPWPVTESGAPLDVDFVLATPTEPKGPTVPQGKYATPREIADAFRNATQGRKYFDENRRVGISTTFDEDILHCLESTG